jgi:hypothetical protein
MVNELSRRAVLLAAAMAPAPGFAAHLATPNGTVIFLG